MSVLFTEIDIDGQGCLLVPDEISEQVPSGDCVLLQDGGAAAAHPFWVRESDVAKARAINPSAQVYGLWQVLSTSGQIDSTLPIQIFSTGERTGLYLQSDGGAAVRAGQFTGGRFPYEIPHTLADAVRIEVQPDALKRPRHSARLPSEIMRAQARAQRSRFIFGATGGLVLALSGLGYAWMQHVEAARRTETLAALRADTVAARGRLGELEATHELEQGAPLSRAQALIYVLDLAAHTRAIAIDTTSLSPPGFTATAKGLTADLAWASRIAPQANGDYRVVYKEGSAGGAP